MCLLFFACNDREIENCILKTSFIRPEYIAPDFVVLHATITNEKIINAIQEDSFYYIEVVEDSLYLSPDENITITDIKKDESTGNYMFAFGTLHFRKYELENNNKFDSTYLSIERKLKFMFSKTDSILITNCDHSATPATSTKNP